MTHPGSNQVLGDFDDKWTSLKALIFLTLTLRYFFGEVVLKGVIVLYTAVVPVIFSVSVFTRYQIGSVSVFSVGIVPPLFVLFAPFFPQKGGSAP